MEPGALIFPAVELGHSTGDGRQHCSWGTALQLGDSSGAGGQHWRWEQHVSWSAQ